MKLLLAALIVLALCAVAFLALKRRGALGAGGAPRPFSPKKPVAQPEQAPPPGWNKTLADLFKELEDGTRKTVGSPEADWAREYERSLLPQETRFPRKGDVYEVMAPCEATCLVFWEAPYTGGGVVTLAPGWQLRVAEKPRDEKPIAVYADAVDYAGLEPLVVAPEDRCSAKYRGFVFSVSTRVLSENCRLVAEGAI